MLFYVERDGEEIEVEIDGHGWDPGVEEAAPGYSDGGLPAERGSFDRIKATVVVAGKIIPFTLTDEEYEEAMEALAQEMEEES